MKTPSTYLIRLLSFFLFSLLISSNNTYAQAGKPDSSFGVNGIVQTNLLGPPCNGSNTVLVQGDGKIVICGDNEQPELGDQGLLLRYNVNGSLDSTFGYNGVVQSLAYTFTQAALRPNGDIVIAADSTNWGPDNNFEELICYNADGLLDSSFGNKGVVILDSIGYIESMLIDKNGRILLLSSFNGPTSVISRYLANGEVDTGFNHNGILNVIAGVGNIPLLGLQSANRLIVAFINYTSDSIIRYDSTGKKDTTFMSHNPAYPFISMVVQPDNKIILGTTSCNDSACGFMCLRINADGSPDTTFNHTGIDTIITLQPLVELYAMALDQNNNLLLTGTYSTDDDYTNFIVTVRALPSGKPDLSFGTGGEEDLRIGMSHDVSYSVAAQSDNKILITGTSEVRIYQREDHLATIRYNVNGSLDPSFGTNGIDTPFIRTPTFSNATAILNDGNGKILIGAIGESTLNTVYSIIRYDEDGNIDSSFNHGRPLQTGLYGVPAIALDNEKIVEVYPTDSIHIIRYNPDGSPDSSFGRNGYVSTFVSDTTIWYGENSSKLSLMVQSDGKLVIAGHAGYGNFYFVNIARLNADGTVDSSFGKDGISGAQVQLYSDIFSLVQQPDGKILLGAGQSENLGYLFHPFYLLRFNANGDLDSSFGMNGVATKFIDSLSAELASFILLQPDGKILQLGSLYGAASTQGIAAIRFTANGIIDSSFGINGVVKTYIPAGYLYASAGALQPDGKILVTGEVLSVGGYGYNSILIRYQSNGAIDSSFAANAIIILTIPPAAYYDPGNQSNDLILQSDKILIAGYNDYKSETDLYIARFLNDITLGIINFSSPKNTILIYPNPIHQTATLKYTLSESENITINLFDINGKLVQTFIANQNQPKGNYSEQLNFSSSLASGNYFLTIGNAREKETVKITKQ